MASFVKFSLVVAVAGLVSVGAVRAETVKKAAEVVSQNRGNCPIAMMARQETGILSPKEVGTPSKRQAAEPAHRIHFTLMNENLRTVEAVQLRLNGWDGVAQRVPATSAAEHAARGWKLADVKVDIGPHDTAQTDVWVRGLTSVDSVDLTSVRYADGSTWTPSSASACSIVPDPTMLISQK